MTSDDSIAQRVESAPTTAAGLTHLADTLVPDLESRANERADDVLLLAIAVSDASAACLSLIDGAEIWVRDPFGLGSERLQTLHRTVAAGTVEAARLVRFDDVWARAGGDLPSATAFSSVLGVPLVSMQGRVLGAISLFDRASRGLSAEKVAALEAMARQAARLVEARKSLRTKRETEQRLALIFESAIDYAIITLDAEGRIRSWNAGAQAIFGWREDEVLEAHLDMLFLAEDRAKGIPQLNLRRSAEHGREIDERYYLRKDHSHFWGTGETMPLVTRSGTTRGYLKILRDRTSQKRIKEALEYQASILQAITDYTAEALFQVDVDFRIVFVNPAAEDMFGWSRYELIGVDLWSRLRYVEADGTPAIRGDSPYIVALKSRASLIRRPDIFVRRDGRFIDVLVSFKPIVADGLVTGAVLSLVDVTEQKEVEEALRATQERYQLAVSASDTVGSWDWDLVAQTITADTTFAQQYGVDPHLAAKGAPLETFQVSIHPEDRDLVFAEINASIQTRTSYVGEYRLKRHDGTIRWVSTYARCLYDTGGRPVRCPGLSVDITERKQAEERRAALLELEDGLRNKETVADITGSSAEIVCRLLGVSRAGFGLVDPTGDYVVIERDFAQDGSQTIAGIYRFSSYGSYGDELKSGNLVVVNDVSSDLRTDENGDRWRALGVGAVVNVPLKADGRLAAMFFAHSATPRVWTPDDIALISNIADRTWAAIARAHAAEQERMLTGELRHRIKNTITMVQSIAKQTMRKAATPEEAFTAFEARLLALSEAQNILTQSSWSAAKLQDIVDGSLRPHWPADRSRILVSGPDTNLSAQSALSFALALHELATNATKYGALANESGSVAIDWCVDEVDEKPVFRFRWREQNGPPVTPPTRKGFGTRLIKGGFARTFTVDIIYAREGLTCEISASAHAL